MTTIIKRKKKPLFAVVPYKKYQKLVAIARERRPSAIIPHEVVGFIVHDGFSPIKAWRTYLNISPQQLAESLGISPSAFSHLEDIRIQQKEILQKVANIFGISIRQMDIQCAANG